MGDVDDFFNRKQKKKQKNKPKKVVTADDLFKEDAADNENQNPDSKQEDEWIEQSGEQEFVIESVGGIKRLELEERNPASDGEGDSSDGEKGETSWKQKEAGENTGLPGDNPPAARAGLPEAREVDPVEQKSVTKASERAESNSGGSKYVPPSQRMAKVVEPKAMPFRRREKIDIESQADFPTLGAAAETIPDGFDQVQGSKAARAWTSSSMAPSQSTGVSNRFQSLQNS